MLHRYRDCPPVSSFLICFVKPYHSLYQLRPWIVSIQATLQWWYQMTIQGNSKLVRVRLQKNTSYYFERNYLHCVVGKLLLWWKLLRLVVKKKNFINTISNCHNHVKALGYSWWLHAGSSRWLDHTYCMTTSIITLSTTKHFCLL